MDSSKTIHQQRSQEDVLDVIGRYTTEVARLIPYVSNAAATYEEQDGKTVMVLVIEHELGEPFEVRCEIDPGGDRPERRAIGLYLDVANKLVELATRPEPSQWGRAYDGMSLGEE